MAQKAWGEMLSSMCVLSDSIWKVAASAGYPDFVSSINLVKENDQDTILAMVIDGKIAYSATDYVLPNAS